MRGRFTIPCLVIGLLALFGYGLALSIPEGWELLARSRSGDPAAREALERAYRAGDPQAIAALGALYLDPARSRLLFRESFGRGSPWAGFKDWARLTPHKLRHSYASALMEAGWGIDEVKELLGHASIATTQIYVHASRKRLEEAARALPDVVSLMNERRQ